MLLSHPGGYLSDGCQPPDGCEPSHNYGICLCSRVHSLSYAAKISVNTTTIYTTTMNYDVRHEPGTSLSFIAMFRRHKRLGSQEAVFKARAYLVKARQGSLRPSRLFTENVS